MVSTPPYVLDDSKAVPAALPGTLQTIRQMLLGLIKTEPYATGYQPTVVITGRNKKGNQKTRVWKPAEQVGEIALFRASKLSFEEIKRHLETETVLTPMRLTAGHYLGHGHLLLQVGETSALGFVETIDGDTLGQMAAKQALVADQTSEQAFLDILAGVSLRGWGIFLNGIRRLGAVDLGADIHRENAIVGKDGAPRLIDPRSLPVQGQSAKFNNLEEVMRGFSLEHAVFPDDAKARRDQEQIIERLNAVAEVMGFPKTPAEASEQQGNVGPGNLIRITEQGVGEPLSLDAPVGSLAPKLSAIKNYLRSLDKRGAAHPAHVQPESPRNRPIRTR